MILVLDTETTTDATQRLTFGSWRVYARAEYQDEIEGTPAWRDYHLAGEGLVHADDLAQQDSAGYELLTEYVRQKPGLTLESRSEWLTRVFFPVAFRMRGLVVGFNLPFDLSRLAESVGRSRRRRRGFSFVLAGRDTAAGRRENSFRPRLHITPLDSKRAFIEFGSARDTDPVDLLPDEGEPDPQHTYIERGRFLDLRTLAFALTDQSHSLDSACEAFGTEHRKEHTEKHGVITPAYIDYNRADVLATWELYCRMREEYERHPISLPPTRAWSSASIGKAYLGEMGIHPILERQPDFPRDVLGYAMAAYFGGRAECRIRRDGVPVVYVDFLSMYPTVNTLMENWRLLTAASLSVEDATAEVRELLETITLNELFDPQFWPRLNCLVELEPDGDILPVRARYDQGPEWQIGLNPLTSKQPLWYSLADAIGSKLLTGKAPQVRRAIRIAPSQKQQRGLQAVALRGTVTVDPNSDDFFQRVIELRRGRELQTLPEPERRRLMDFLKVLANSASYGVFAETNVNEGTEAMRVERYGLDVGSAELTDLEEPGRWCFPPLAAFIAGGARLMLAMLERCVTDLGGSYAFCDTDSMAVVSTRRGGRVRMTAGPDLHALSWAQVDALVERFEQLKPYDRDTVAATLIKVEEENFSDESRTKRNQLYCYMISAKRYCLYNRGQGRIDLRKVSESGLGHLLDPEDRNIDPFVPGDEDSSDAQEQGRPWIRAFWEELVLGSHAKRKRPWLDRPALSQFSVSSPALLGSFAADNAGKPYAEQVKPFNFMLIAQDAGLGPDRKILIAPYERDPARWLALKWRDRRDGREHAVDVRDSAGGLETVRVVTYREQLRRYAMHIEAKSWAFDGTPCRPLTSGLLLRRPVDAAGAIHIGKEAARLDQVSVGLVPPEGGYSVFEDDWALTVMVLAQVPIETAMSLTGRSRSQTMEIRAGRARSTVARRREITARVGGWCRESLQTRGIDAEVISAWLSRIA